MFHSFEPQSWRDYALIPWWLLRYAFAWVWAEAWATWKIGKGIPAGWANLYGRWESPEPVMCPRCLWAGPRRWVIHTYQDDGVGDVEPVDECPRCGCEM